MVEHRALLAVPDRRGVRNDLPAALRLCMASCSLIFLAPQEGRLTAYIAPHPLTRAAVAHNLSSPMRMLNWAVAWCLRPGAVLDPCLHSGL